MTSSKKKNPHAPANPASSDLVNSNLASSNPASSNPASLDSTGFDPATDEELENIDDPAELFRRAVGDVKPVQDDRVAATPSKVKARPRQLEKDEHAVMREAMLDDRDPDELDAGEHLAWRRDGVQNRVMKKLRNGYYSIQDELDLHGMTVAEARVILAEFLAHVVDTHQSCCVRIIHGKGRKTATDKPIMKPFVSSWLRQRRHVVAFCSCKPVHGGTGAVYVLIRRGKIEPDMQIDS